MPGCADGPDAKEESGLPMRTKKNKQTTNNREILPQKSFICAPIQPATKIITVWDHIPRDCLPHDRVGSAEIPVRRLHCNRFCQNASRKTRQYSPESSTGCATRA